MSWRKYIQTGGLLGGLSVALGAFGAHGLKDVLSSTDMEIYQTAVFYQFIHSVALLFFGLLKERFPALPNWPGHLFITGIVVFSGSLYLLVGTQLRWMGAITPIGGICFITAWLGLFWSSSRI